jgi:hypothetical protein
VRFGPNSTGAKSAALRFRTDASGSPHLVNLTGNSVDAPATAPFASLIVGALGFGDQQVNTRSGAQAVTLTNTGTATLTLSSAPDFFGGDTSQFEIVSDGCGTATLAPGASCTVTVRFFPGSVGQKSTALRFQSDAPGSPHLVSLTGNGVAAPTSAPAISFSPAAVAFGNQTVGSISGAQTVIVTNTGTADLAIASVTVAGGDNGDFVGAATNCATVAPGGQCYITLYFAPLATGNRSSSIVVVSNVAGGSTQIVPVSGTGVAPGTPTVSLNPQSVAFGDQQVSTPSGAQAVTITNTGTATLTVSSAPSVVGGNTGQFEIL